MSDPSSALSVTGSDLIAGLALIASITAILVGEWRYRTSFRLAWYKEVVDWARACVKAMSAAHEICARHSTDVDHMRSRQRETLEQLTSLIDEGRFVFENDRTDGYGSGKPHAYQGYRPDVLDYLVDAYNLLKGIDVTDASDRDDGCESLISLKREFVSDIQDAIEPNWFSRQAKITRKTTG